MCNSMIRINIFIITLVSTAWTDTIPQLTGNLTQLSDEQISELVSEPTMNINENDRAKIILSETLIDSTTENGMLSETNLSNATLKIYNNCLTNQTYGTVEVVNATRLMELLKFATSSNRSESKNDGESQARTCLLVLFYARWCVFSSQAAPHFNALPRFFPLIKAVAIDASTYQNFNTQFGIVGVPTLMFIYNGKPLVKFNDTSYTLEMFARFVTTYTALEPNASLYVTSADFSGPVQSTPSNETDYCLVVSWIFIAACTIYFTFQSRWWRQFVELVQNTWRESNAQHEHVD